MGKQVRANDTLAFPSVLTAATVANSATRLNVEDLEFLLSTKARRSDEKFIQHTYKGIFYTQPELEFLDDFWVGIREMESPFKRSVALAAILRPPSSASLEEASLSAIPPPTRTDAEISNSP